MSDVRSYSKRDSLQVTIKTNLLAELKHRDREHLPVYVRWRTFLDVPILTAPRAFPGTTTAWHTNHAGLSRVRVRGQGRGGGRR